MTLEQAIVFVAFPVAGYLLGSIPFAWVIGKTKGVDIRTVGSKNIGATNLGRTLGKRFFWAAFLLDAGKGFFPVLIVSLLVPAWRPLPNWAPLITAGACFFGHLFPIWLRFKGGKGVATGFGAVLGFWPVYTVPGLIAGAIFVFVLIVYRYISVASMGAAIAFSLLVAWFVSWKNRYVNTYLEGEDRGVVIAVAAFFALIIIWRHRANIARLIKGTEPQIGQKQIDKAKMDPK